jgi:SAM-dependent MidA family methyltransferase
LQTGNPFLIELIRAEIETRGPVSFAWFMKQALYHPEHGYYSSGRAAIGRHGDYFTNVSVGPLFGRLLAAQFTEIWERLGRGDNFVIVEQGAHHGDFARDVLEAVRDKPIFSALRYRIIEPFPVLQERQSQTLAEFHDQVSWSDSVDAIEPFVGIHFSNELLDAMPVHLLVSKDASPGGASEIEWSEKFVDWQNDQFVFVVQPIVNPALQAHLQKVEAASRRLSEGTRQDAASTFQTIEVNLSALDWIDTLSEKITRGYVLAIDYGFSRDEFYEKDRSAGTLQCRAKHRQVASPFEAIGHADITAHVDWTSIAERAEARGLRASGFTDQHHFLTGIISELPDLLKDADSRTSRRLQTLLHPEMLGRSFQVLALAKDIDATTGLSGFKFARDARALLGLTGEGEIETIIRR